MTTTQTTAFRSLLDTMTDCQVLTVSQRTTDEAVRTVADQVLADRGVDVAWLAQFS